MRIRIITTGSHKHAVQVVTKVGRKLVVHKHFGTYETVLEKDKLLSLAEEYIQKQTHQTNLFFDVPMFWSLNEVEIINSQPLYLYRLLAQAYDRLDLGGDSLVRDLVIARIYSPVSKRETRDILADVFGRPYSLRTIYRHLKKAMKNGLRETFQQALIKYARNGLGDDLHLVFYDVTTLAFASQVKTDLKNFGYSKDHRNQDTQVVVGLVVNKEGFPLYFDVFSGNTFEGSTFVQVVRGVQKLLGCSDLVVVADAGMLSQKNIDELDESGIQFVVGARISNLSGKLLSEISNALASKTDGMATETAYKKYRLLADYSTKRANKDRSDREKQWKKAEQALTRPEFITRRYRFLKTDGKKNYVLNDNLLEKAKLVEGIKGYLTNSKLDTVTITTRYHDLWRIEKAFRVTKTDLEARPIFHRLDETIKAHLLIVFASLAVVRLLEIQTELSIHQIVKNTSRIFTHTIRNARTGQITTLETKPPDEVIPTYEKLNRFYSPGY